MKVRQFSRCCQTLGITGVSLLLVFLAVAVVAWPQVSPRQQSAVPKLTLSQIENLVLHGVPDSTMSTQIQRRGLAFTPTSAILESLRAKGAGPLTLAAISGEGASGVQA